MIDNRDELIENLELVRSERYTSNRTYNSPRLKTLAKYINEFVDGYTAHVRGGYHESCRVYGRVVITGNCRSTTILEVRNSDGVLAVRHNSAETYRTNYDVVNWILNTLKN
jgi:hypothetical protein